MLHTTRRPRLARVFAVVLATLVALTTVVTGGTTAAAAGPYTTDATLTNIAFVNTEVTSGSDAQLSAQWSLPNNPTTPAGFTLPLGEGIAGRGETFQIRAQDDPTTIIANCVAKTNQIECDFVDSYLEANPLGLRGTVNFWVRVTEEVTTTTEHTFRVGSATATIVVNPVGQCTENCELDWKNNKEGSYDAAKQQIMWWAHIGADEGGMKGGESVRVVDTVGDGDHTLVIDGSYPGLQYSNTVGTNPYGFQVPVNFQPVPRDKWTLNTTTGEVTFTAEAGYYYQVEYLTKVNDNGDSGAYSNRVEFFVNGTSAGTVTRRQEFSGGGGTGIGTDVGKVSLTKQVDGTNLPADLVFTGTYAVTPPSGDVINGTWSLTAGETWTSDEFPRGSRVTLTENTPTQPSTVTWSSPSFSSNDFTLPGGKVTPVTLTNRATVKTGTFSAAKTITGTPAALGMVPTAATFVVDYSYPVGPGFEAGTGELTLPADGSRVESPALPQGVVTLSERTPAAVDGAAWSAPVITPATVTIGAGAAASFTVENPIAETRGGFSLTKTVSGEGAALLSGDETFTVNYTWTAPDASTGAGSVEVAAHGRASEVYGIPAGATVTLAEAAPAAVPGVSWQTPVFTSREFVIQAGSYVGIDLDNPAGLATGTFSVAKTVTGSGASLVPADTTFTVDYSYPAGKGFVAGSGSLAVKADGTIATSAPLPFGAVVTLSESTPADIAGGTWGAGSFDLSEITIGDGTVAKVALTNTFTATPDTPGRPLLPQTGTSEAIVPLIALGVLLLAVGGGLFAFSRRRRV